MRSTTTLNGSPSGGQPPIASDSADTRARPMFRLVNFPEPKRLTVWQDRPNDQDTEWVRLWENLHTVHELAPHAVTGLAIIVDKMIERLTNPGLFND
jgi:hypothetical protein